MGDNLFNFENDINIFSSRDKIRDQLIEIAKKQLVLENFDFNQSSYLSYLINVLSVLSSNNIFYNSNIWKQFFLTTATQKESIINISDMLGYQTNMAFPSNVSVLVSIPISTILKNETYASFKLNGKTGKNEKLHTFYSNNIKFVPINDIEITLEKVISGGDENSTYKWYVKEYIKYSNTDDTYSTIPCIFSQSSNNEYVIKFMVNCVQLFTLSDDEGEFTFPQLKPFEFFYKDLYFNSGQISDINVTSVNMDFNAKIRTIDQTTQTVNSEWVRYSSIPLIPKGEYGYVLKHINNGVRIFFGNGVYGIQPKSNDSCIITMYLTNGEDGNVIPGSILKSDQIYIKTVNNKIKQYQLTVINPEPAYGGKNIPTIDEIRQGAIAHVRSNERLVSNNDYNLFTNIVTDIPTSTSTTIMKRSDLKRNEISLFTDIIYNDTVNNDYYTVPTRNEIWRFDTTSQTPYIIKNTDEESIITVDGEEYYSLFNIEVDIDEKESKYYYIANEITAPLNIIQTPLSNIVVTPYSVYFQLVPGENNIDTFSVKVNYIKSIEDISDYVLEAQITVPWNGKTYNLANDEVNSYFYLESDDAEQILVSEVGDGEQKFIIKVYDHTTSGPIVLSNSITSTTLKKDLSEFMYSQVIQNGSTYSIYDVPIILKQYYDRIDKSKFNYFIYSKYVNFDVSKYRMLTDSVSLKMSNTYGKSKNMLLNKETRFDVDYIDPQLSIIQDLYDSTSEDDIGIRIAISSDYNFFNNQPFNKTEGGFIVTKTNYNNYEFNFESMRPNDIFKVKSDGKKYVYNGEIFVEPIFDIPLKIKLVVWIDDRYSGTDSSLVQRIKDALIDEMYQNFGYDKKILISEIIRIVKSLYGVKNCKVLEPECDVEFTYNIEDLSEEQLISYTPDLIYFDASSIEIDLRV